MTLKTFFQYKRFFLQFPGRPWLNPFAAHIVFAKNETNRWMWRTQKQMRRLCSILCCAVLAGCQPASDPSADIQPDTLAGSPVPGHKASAPTVPEPADCVILELGRPGMERIMLLPPAPASAAKRLVAGPPHCESQPQVPLAMRTAVVLDGVRYALEDGEIILLYGDGSRTWRSPGIGKLLLDAAQRSADQATGIEDK